MRLTLHCAVVIYLTCTCMQSKATPVHKAAENGHVGALRTLVSAGADVNAANVVSIKCVNFTFCFYYAAIGIQIRNNRLIIVD